MTVLTHVHMPSYCKHVDMGATQCTRARLEMLCMAKFTRKRERNSLALKDMKTDGQNPIPQQGLANFHKGTSK